MSYELLPEAYDLPLGYKFEPTKEELVAYFLTRKLTGQPLEAFHNDFIIDWDVYSDHPSNIMAITHRKEEEDGFLHGYFFTPLKKTSVNGKRINRCIPEHGTWVEKAATKKVTYQGEVIGIYKYYKFNPTSGSKGSMLNKDGWMMHEYSLSDYQDSVLCHITNRKDYHNSHNKSTKGRQINMVMDEAGPSKRSRVDRATACFDMDAEDDYTDKGVNDKSLVLFENGYTHAMEQIVAQEDHDGGHVIGIPAGEMAPIQAASELTSTSSFDLSTQEGLDRLEAFFMA